MKLRHETNFLREFYWKRIINRMTNKIKYIAAATVSAVIMFFLDNNKASLPNHVLEFSYLVFIMIVGYCTYKFLDKRNN
ncbi:hypothetical protein NT96_00665 [Oenococcus kitaharae]|nr:hypothetical protein NT96_00665 [Oenococcus kitaharae]OEY86001.1 hypothetical protein NV75_00615 [Oenococcus kitaharae]